MEAVGELDPCSVHPDNSHGDYGIFLLIQPREFRIYDRVLDIHDRFVFVYIERSLFLEFKKINHFLYQIIAL